MIPKVKKIQKYSVDLVKANPDSLFIFGDNTLCKGQLGQACIRYCKNTHGIPTKKYPSMNSNAFFVDSEYEDNISLIKSAIDNIPTQYDTIVFPEDGIGTGLAKLNTGAPKTYAFMIKTINEKFGNVY